MSSVPFSFPYNAAVAVGQDNWYYDKPSVGAAANYSRVAANELFKTILMYKPDGGIWVPITLWTWRWKTDMTNNGSSFADTFNGASSIAWADNAAAANGRYPYWDSTYTNGTIPYNQSNDPWNTVY